MVNRETNLAFSSHGCFSGHCRPEEAVYPYGQCFHQTEQMWATLGARDCRGRFVDLGPMLTKIM